MGETAIIIAALEAAGELYKLHLQLVALRAQQSDDVVKKQLTDALNASWASAEVANKAAQEEAAKISGVL